MMTQPLNIDARSRFRNHQLTDGGTKTLAARSMLSQPSKDNNNDEEGNINNATHRNNDMNGQVNCDLLDDRADVPLEELCRRVVSTVTPAIKEEAADSAEQNKKLQKLPRWWLG